KSQGQTSVRDFIAQYYAEHGHTIRLREHAFLRVFEPFFEAYQVALRRDNSIDFSDMINLAATNIRQGAPIEYDYVIVDEYQDTSMARYRLIRSVLDVTGAKFFAVGDDWQSIYRFTGSDIALSAQFEKYYGYYKLLKIEKTYRYSQELISVAESFILQNPHQLRKQMNSAKSLRYPVLVVRTEQEQLHARESGIKHLVAQYGEAFQLALLARNNFEIDNILKADQSRRNPQWKMRYPARGTPQSNRVL